MFSNPLSEFCYTRSYARWLPAEQRRETYPESVQRVMDFFREIAGDKIPAADLDEAQQAMLDFSVLPSMRILAMGTEAVRRCNVASFNCAYLPIDSIESFVEILYILMQGTGVGFSIESWYVDQLPSVTLEEDAHTYYHTVEDTTEGWADALWFGLHAWFNGSDVEFDYSQIRPAGSPLKTKGGRASGPEPLEELLTFVREKVFAAQGRKLTTLECLDIANRIATVVVVGGVRRSSEISLGDLEDSLHRNAKRGAYWDEAWWRAMSNNSAVYNGKPSYETFCREWEALVSSGSGERGIFNRDAVTRTAPRRRDKSYRFGTNPCAEVTLRPFQKCNLSEVVARSADTLDDLRRKVRIAALFGTLQSTLTDFPYLRPEWKRNCDEERLLGVSVTGEMDCPAFRDATPEELESLRDDAVSWNAVYAKMLGINRSAAVTCVKPSGTASLVADASPGIHPRYAPYYKRRVRISATDPLSKLLLDSGVPMSPENDDDPVNPRTWVATFPMKAPAGAICRNDRTALQQLEHWLRVKRHWCEHNPSATIYVGTDEWDAVRDWVYDHFDFVGGLSFLERDNTLYRQAPYEEITAEEYESLLADFPVIDYNLLSRYETEDRTEGSKEYACTGDKCEII